jgi:putative peptide maturation system protein
MMSEPTQTAVCAALGYLAEVIHEGLRPDDAQRRLRLVEAGHPDVYMRLLWATEAYDDSLHYDVILRPTNGDTISVSMCRNDTLPWPLRGIQRWSEANVLQVNGRTLTMEQAVAFLDVLWNEAPLMERMINSCLIKEELENEPIVISDDELQSGIDGLRRTHRLYTAEETESWLRQCGMTHAQLEQLVLGTLTCAHLRKRVAANRSAHYFESHCTQFDVAHIARIELPDRDGALLLRKRATKDVNGFAAAMQEEFASGDARVRCTFTSLRRRDLSSELEEHLFAAAPGDVVGPILVGTAHVLGCLLKLRPACYDADTQAAIEQILFEQWLSERRSQATVTWHWGRSPDAG